jgi:urocanate hydratase
LYESEIYEISFDKDKVIIEWYESDKEREEFSGEPSKLCYVSGEEAIKLFFAIKMSIIFNED